MTNARWTLAFLTTIITPYLLMARPSNSEKEMVEKETSYIAQLLRQNGVDIKNSSQVEFVETGMTHVYRIEGPQTWYLKLTPLEAKKSAGAFYSKRLWSPFTPESRLHGTERRWALRPLIEQVNALAGKSLLIPPYLLSREGKKWEFVTPGPEKTEYPELANHLATGWLGIDAVPNPHHSDSPYLWDPSAYPASNLHELALHLKRISDLATPLLDDQLRKVLTHERDRYLQYSALVNPFMESLGLEGCSPQEVLDHLENPYSQVRKRLGQRARERIEQIHQWVKDLKKERNLSGDVSLEDVKKSFYKENKSAFREGCEQWEWDRTTEDLRFFQCVFTLEREGLCSEKTRLLGRRIAQCEIASILANDILNGEATLVKALLEMLVKICPLYDRVETAPKSLIHGGAHPHEFLQDKKGNWILGGCETLYVGCVYRDIAEEYVRKLVRDSISRRITTKEALEKIKAVLIPGWFDDWQPDIMGYPVIEFAQELETLFAAYSMDPSQIDSINLTITPVTFLKEMRERLTFEKIYRTKLYPELLKTSS